MKIVCVQVVAKTMSISNVINKPYTPGVELGSQDYAQCDSGNIWFVFWNRLVPATTN